MGIIMSQSPEYVAPHGSSQAIFGTNPFAVCVGLAGEQCCLPGQCWEA